MSVYVFEEVEKALDQLGERILTKEGQTECVKRYGLQVCDEAIKLYKFRQEDHEIPEEFLKRREKTIQRMAGIATANTILER